MYSVRDKAAKEREGTCFIEFWAVRKLLENFGLNPPFWGNLRVKLKFSAPIFFSVGKLQLSAPPIFFILRCRC